MIARHFDSRSEAAGDLGDLVAVGGNQHLTQGRRAAGRLPGILNQRFARIAEEELAREARRGDACGDDPQSLAVGHVMLLRRTGVE